MLPWIFSNSVILKWRQARNDSRLFHITSSKWHKLEMIQTETRIHRHELSVALAKARFFRCYKTHLDCNWYQKKLKGRRTRKQRRTKKFIPFDYIESRWKKGGKLLRCHSQHKSLFHTYMNLSLIYVYKEIKIILK